MTNVNPAGNALLTIAALTDRITELEAGIAEYSANGDAMQVRIRELEKQDELHWKTRDILLKERDQLRKDLDAAPEPHYDDTDHYSEYFVARLIDWYERMRAKP